MSLGLSQLPCRPSRAQVAWYRNQPRDWPAFSALVHRCHQTAAQQFAAGDQVALYTDEAYPFAAALLGLWSAGCVPILPSNATAGTRALLIDQVAGFWGEFEGAWPLPDQAESGAEVLKPLPEDSRLVLFTSGSTGEPKPVIKHLRQLDAELRALQRQFGTAIGDRPVLATVSHQHIYGLLFKVLWPLVSDRPFDSRIWRDTAELVRYARTLEGAVWVASPAHLKRLAHDFPWEDARAGLVEVFSSGGPLLAATAQEWQQHWRRSALEVYGSTETGGIAWRRQSDGIAWTPLPGVEVEVAEDGLLRLRSPHLPHSGWQNLDDGGRDCGDGCFELTGRRDRIVKIEEKRLSLPELESRLLAHPWLDEAAALVLPGEREQLAVVAVVSTEGRVALQELGKGAFSRRLRQELAQHFEPVLLPRRWRFVEALPVNAQGKLEQRRLAVLFDAPKLPTVLSGTRGENTVELNLWVPAELAYLPGHFPGRPILPGVVQIHWAVHYARQCLGIDGVFTGMETIKFRQLTLPERELQLALTWNPDRKRLQFTYRSARGEHTSGRILIDTESTCAPVC